MEGSIRRRPLRTRTPSRKFLENATTCFQEEEEERLHSVAKKRRLIFHSSRSTAILLYIASMLVRTGYGLYEVLFSLCLGVRASRLNYAKNSHQSLRYYRNPSEGRLHVLASPILLLQWLFTSTSGNRSRLTDIFSLLLRKISVSTLVLLHQRRKKN